MTTFARELNARVTGSSQSGTWRLSLCELQPCVRSPCAESRWNATGFGRLIAYTLPSRSVSASELRLGSVRLKRRREGLMGRALHLVLNVGVCAVVLLFHGASAAAQVVGHVTGYHDVTLEYEHVAAGETTLVFVHGWMCDRTYWREQRSPFAGQFGVVLLDLGGHGQSAADRSDWSVDGFAEDVLAVVRHLDLDRVILVGHSMGGPVIAEAARRAPDRVIGVLGVDTYQYLDAPWLRGQGVRNLVSRLRADFEGTTAGFVQQMFTAASDSTLFGSVLRHMTGGDPAVGIPSTQSMFEWYRDRAVESLNAIQRPLWTINSADYVGTDVAQLKASVPGIEVRLIDGVGHFVMLEDPHRFNELLLEAVNAILNAGPEP